MYSVILYLNDCETGGETRFYKNCQKEQQLILDHCTNKLTGNAENVTFEVKPKAGRMLVFYYTLMHEGFAASNKYIIRQDVVYRRSPPICTMPEDVEAYQIYTKAQLLAERGEYNEAMLLFRKCFKMSPNLSKVYRMG